MGLSVKVDSKTSVAGKIVGLVVQYAGVGPQIDVVEGAAAGAIELDAGSDGKLEGLATVCKYIASLCGDASRAKQLAGASPEDEASISEWLVRAAAEYGGNGNVSEEKLNDLDARLRLRSFVATAGSVSLADIAVYGSTVGALQGLSSEKRDGMIHACRWCDHVGAVTNGVDLFGTLSFRRGEPLDLARRFSEEQKREKERAGGSSGAKEEKKKNVVSETGKTANDGPPGVDVPDAAAVAAARAAKKAAQAEKSAKKASKATDAGDAVKGKGPASTPKKEIDVSVLDIRVGTITKAWEHPGADKLWVESIDVGEAKDRQVVSGLRAFKTAEQMVGARVCVLCNVKKGPLRDEMSEGMVMCASDEAHAVVDFVVPPEGAKNGERVSFEGFEGEPAAVLVPKKKMFETVAPNLATDARGVACYRGVPFMTSAGPCVSSLTEARIK